MLYIALALYRSARCMKTHSNAGARIEDHDAIDSLMGKPLYNYRCQTVWGKPVELFKDFEWWRDPQNGFWLEEGSRIKETWRRVPNNWGFEPIGEDATPEKRKVIIIPPRIERGSGKLEPYFPLREYTGDILLCMFAKIEDDQGALVFVNQFGPLGFFGLQTGEDTTGTIKFAQRARALLRAYQRNDVRTFNRAIGNGFQLDRALGAWLVADRPGPKGRLLFKAGDLFGVIWFQLVRSVSGGATIRECLHCGAWFEAGPGKARRFDASFCSRDHKIDYFNANRSKKRKGG